MTRVRSVLAALFLTAAPVMAQQVTVTGRVTRDGGVPLSGVTVAVRGTSQTTQTNLTGAYTIQVTRGQVLQFRLIGYLPQERTITTATTVNIDLEKNAANLNAVVVTALGQTAEKRSLGSAQCPGRKSHRRGARTSSTRWLAGWPVSR